MESENKSVKWHDFISKINWEDVNIRDREKFNTALEEFRQITTNNLYLESRYKAKLHTLVFTMIITMFMSYLNYSHNSIIISIVLFQIIFTAFSGFTSWGSSKLLEQASGELTGFITRFMAKHTSDESEEK